MTADTPDPDIEAAIAEAFPGRETEAVAPAGPSWNDLNETVRVEFADGEAVYLKVAADGDGSRITRECAVIDYVRAHCDVAVPTVLASDATADPPYLVTAPMREGSLVSQWEEMPTKERKAAIRQVGIALAEMHAETFERQGHVVDGDAEGLTLDTGSWTELLVERIEMIRAVGSSDRFERYFDDVIAAVEANRERLDGAPATLVHGDPAMPNVFRSETTLGFVDWEVAHVGDPARELHRARDQLLGSEDRDDRLVAALHDGYRERAGSLPSGFEDREPVYDAVRYLGTAGFFDKVVEFSEESAEEIAERVESEMADRLDAITGQRASGR